MGTTPLENILNPTPPFLLYKLIAMRIFSVRIPQKLVKKPFSKSS